MQNVEWLLPFDGVLIRDPLISEDLSLCKSNGVLQINVKNCCIKQLYYYIRNTGHLEDFINKINNAEFFYRTGNGL